MCRVCARALLTFSLLSCFHFQLISQRTAFSGRGRDAPGCPARGGGGRFMAELWHPQKVMPCHRTYLYILAWEKNSSGKMTLFFLFFKKTNTSLQKTSSGNALKYTQHLQTYTQRTIQRGAEMDVYSQHKALFWCKSISPIGTVYLHCPALGTFVWEGASNLTMLLVCRLVWWYKWLNFYYYGRKIADSVCAWKPPIIMITGWLTDY